MLDRLVMLYLLHTPEVAPQLHAGATASANRRYGGYFRAVDDLLAAPRPRAQCARPSRGSVRVAGGADPDVPWVLSTAPRHGHLDGFDLRANVDAPATDRARLEQLCRHSAPAGGGAGRAPAPGRRRIVLTLKTAWADGTRQIVFEPLELPEKLAALTPRPRINLVIHHGVLAPHSSWRARAVTYGAPPAAMAGAAITTSETNNGPAMTPAPRQWAWADPMRRAFDIDGLACPRCGGRLQLMATVENPDTVRAILAALAESQGMAERAPPFAPGHAISQTGVGGA
jgi:hypothetical protein